MVLVLQYWQNHQTKLADGNNCTFLHVFLRPSCVLALVPFWSGSWCVLHTKQWPWKVWTWWLTAEVYMGWKQQLCIKIFFIKIPKGNYSRTGHQKQNSALRFFNQNFERKLILHRPPKTKQPKSVKELCYAKIPQPCLDSLPCKRGIIFT